MNTIIFIIKNLMLKKKKNKTRARDTASGESVCSAHVEYRAVPSTKTTNTKFSLIGSQKEVDF